MGWLISAFKIVLSPKTAALVNLALVAVMWVLEIIDSLTGGALDKLGIRPRELTSLPEIITAPFLHLGFPHLIANTVPLFILGFLILLSGWRAWAITSMLVIATSGLVVWLLAAPGTITLGASGLVFGWMAFLLARGFFTRDGGQIVIGVVVALLYGGLVWGLLPTASDVSWQGHLGGAIGGVLAAWLLHGQRRFHTLT